LNLRADCGLGHVEFGCRFGETALSGDYPEVAQVVVIQELHVPERSFV
jgi:hypothetical protein